MIFKSGSLDPPNWLSKEHRKLLWGGRAGKLRSWLTFLQIHPDNDLFWRIPLPPSSVELQYLSPLLRVSHTLAELCIAKDFALGTSLLLDGRNVWEPPPSPFLLTLCRKQSNKSSWLFVRLLVSAVLSPMAALQMMFFFQGRPPYAQREMCTSCLHQYSRLLHLYAWQDIIALATSNL